jgi:hypothetical protein
MIQAYCIHHRPSFLLISRLIPRCNWEVLLIEGRASLIVEVEVVRNQFFVDLDILDSNFFVGGILKP